MKTMILHRLIIPSLAFGLLGSLSAGVSVFQDGVDGYAGTVDTEIRGGTPDQDSSTVTVLNPDGSDGGGEVHILIRFDDIVGDGPGQIPPGRQVQFVTLTLNITGGGDDLELYRLSKAWQETTTWNQFDPVNNDGVLSGTVGARAADDTEAVFVVEATASGAAAVITIPLSPSTVQAWVDGAPNHGWAILPTGTDGVDFMSSDNADVANRPKLTVTWGEPGQPFVVGLQNPVVYDQPGVSPGGFNVIILDGSGAGATQVDAGSVQLKIDGVDVPTTLTKSGTTNIVTFQTTDYLASGSTNRVANIAFTDNGTPPTAQSEDLPFQVVPWVSIPADLAVDEAAVDKGMPGFRVRVHQMAVARPGGNDLPAPLIQLNDGYIDPATTQPYENRIYSEFADPPFDDDDFTYVEGVVNWEHMAGVSLSPPAAGNFNPNDPIPGIPGLDWDGSDDEDTTGVNNIAAEFITYLELEPGHYSMGVNSDDGFVVTVGHRASDPLAEHRLGLYDGGRGATDSIFPFVVEQAGIYPFGLVWWEGGGGASVEWFTVAADGTKTLINDSAVATSVKAYREGPTRPQVRLLEPFADATDVPVESSIRIVLGDGTTQVDTSSIQLTINGEPVVPVVDKSGAITTITYDPPAVFIDEAVINVGLTFSDNASPPNVRTASYSFTAGRSLELLFAIDETMMWRYNNTGADLGTAWKETAYDDSAWPQGAALLAAESGATAEPIRTTLVRTGPAGEEIITDYFRGRFNLTEVPFGGRLQLRHVVDDSVIFYINGEEVHRFNLPEGTAVNYLTTGSDHENAYEGPFLIVANNLVVGENVIAAEVHQASATSSDSVFGAELAAVTSIPPQPEIKSRDPAPDAVNVPLDANIQIVVSDGAAQVQADSVQLTINDEPVSPVVTKVGSDTTIMYDPPADFPEQTVIRVGLTLGDDASPPNVVTDNYTFTTGYGFEVVLAVDEATMWRYSNVAADLGTAWKETDYDDSAWPEGAALLAAETGATIEPIRTPLTRLGPASEEIITDYFRGRFNLTELPVGGRMLLRFVVDDGAVFYINGEEVYRFGIPEGPVDATTLAASNEGRDHYDGPFLLVLDNLVVGENVIAAELHQTTADSSDSVFGAELAVVTSTTSATDGPQFLPPSLGANGEITIDWSNASGDETLQESGDLINWDDVTSPAKPYVVTPDGTGQKFYRLMRP